MMQSSSTGVSNPPLRLSSRSIDDYALDDQIGEGTYGQVYRGRHKETGTIVALKKIRMENEKEGFPFTAIREVKILKELVHKNIVRLLEIVSDVDVSDKTRKGSIYLVFEFMHHDLAGLMDSPMCLAFKEGQIKCYMKQLLEGIFFLHKNNILHRDIKASNLLINNDGILKLADFGLARPVISESGLQYTNNVITLWYRPPELLLGEEKYGPAVDIWSAGCILAELLLKKPLFPGKTEVDQIALIWDGLGDPTADWPEVTKLKGWNTMRPQGPAKHPLRDRFAKLPIFDKDKYPNSAQAAISLLERMLALNPQKRITAQEALDSDWFWTQPAVMEPKDIPHYPSCHEWTAKKRRTQSNPASSSSASQPLAARPSHQMPSTSRPVVSQGHPSASGHRPDQRHPSMPVQPHHPHLPSSSLHNAHHYGHSQIPPAAQYGHNQQHQTHAAHPKSGQYHPHQPQHHAHRPPSHTEPDLQAPPAKRHKPTDSVAPTNPAPSRHT